VLFYVAVLYLTTVVGASVKGKACPYCINCTKFGQLILRKIIKIIATRCQILRLKCTKFDFGWGSAQTPLGELTALQQTIAGFKGPLRGRDGRGRDGDGREQEGREGREREG